MTAGYRQQCCFVMPRGSTEDAGYAVLHSLGDSVAAAGSSGNATKLSSPLNFLFESVVSVEQSCSCESAHSVGGDREMLSRVDFVPQPGEDGSDFGQSFRDTETSYTNEASRYEEKEHRTYQPRSAPPDKNDVSELRTQSQLPATPFSGSVLLRTNFDTPAVKHWKSSVSGSSGIWPVSTRPAAIIVAA